MYNYTEKKIVAALSSNLEIGIALNVIGHMSISLGAFIPKEELMGRNVLLDASAVEHVGISKYPFIITKLKHSKLKKLINLIKSDYREEIFIIDYPIDMLETGHDDELAKSLLEKNEEDLTYLGVVLYGNSQLITELTGKFTLWK